MCVCVCVCVNWGITLPSKTPALSLFCQAPHKSKFSKALSPLPIPFNQFVPLYFVLLQSSLKSLNPCNIKIFHP